jgi:S1-C subfamily serine protease
MSGPYETRDTQHGDTGGTTATAVREEPEAWWPPPQAGHVGGGGYGAWGPNAWTPQPPPPSSKKPVRTLAAIGLAVAIAAAAGGVGFALGRGNSNAPSTSITGSSKPSDPSGSSGSGSSTPTGGGSGSSGSSTAVNAAQIAANVDPALVDVNTQLAYQNASAAGTGMVLTSNGEVLTNNHVVEGATSISVTDVGNGQTYSATVVGTDATDDVAVIQLTGASGLKTVSLGNSSTLQAGDSVVAIGNAGGTGGTPSYSSGSVTALNQSITASDELSSNSEQLTGLIEHSATLQPGDSGGSLVNASGQVVGMDTAASSSGNFQFSGQSGSNQNYAIPINQALSIAKQIEAGQSSSSIHIGPTAFLGVEVESTSSAGGSGSGAEIEQVEPGSPAAQAGLASGDVIDSLDGQTIDSPEALSSAMETYKPGDTVQLGWLDSSGQQQSASVVLASGPTG